MLTVVIFIPIRLAYGKFVMIAPAKYEPFPPFRPFRETDPLLEVTFCPAKMKLL
jgi:hypothetical protein